MKIQKWVNALAVLIFLGVLRVTNSFGANDLGTFYASGTSPNDSALVAASVDFVDEGGGQLQITLQNTYAGDTTQIGDVLYGVFFSGATLTSLVSGDAAANSKIWTYPDMHTQATFTSSASPTPLTDPWGLDGSGSVYGLTGSDKEGLVSTGFTGTPTDGLGNMQHQPFDESTAVFIVDYSGAISAISNVKFLYGTTVQSSSEIAAAVPEPAPILLSSLVIGLWVGARRMRTRAG